jgi:arylformamidase
MMDEQWSIAMQRTQLHDLSWPVEEGMPVFPGDPPVRLRDVTGFGDAGYRVSSLSLGSHTGTHVDAPGHFLPGAAGVEAMDPGVLVGPARVVDVRHRGAGDEITLEDIGPALPCSRLLLCTGWDSHYGVSDYFTNPPGLQEAAAREMVARGVRLLGLDTPNVHTSHCAAVHRRLLLGGVVLVEALRGLAPLVGRQVLVTVAPLLLVGADGAPARVFALTGEAVVASAPATSPSL